MIVDPGLGSTGVTFEKFDQETIVHTMAAAPSAGFPRYRFRFRFAVSLDDRWKEWMTNG